MDNIPIGVCFSSILCCYWRTFTKCTGIWNYLMKWSNSDSLMVICLYMFLSVTVYRVFSKDVTSKVFQCSAIPKTICSPQQIAGVTSSSRKNKSSQNTWQRIWSVCEGLWYRIVPQSGLSSFRPVEKIKVIFNFNFFQFQFFFSCLYKRNS